MELLCREIESSTGIQLKTLPRRLANEAQLERLESGNGRESGIVITVGNSMEASRLSSKVLRFGGALKVVKKNWEAEPSSVCLRCAGIGHDRLGECGDREMQSVIYAGAHKVEDRKFGVTGYTTKMGKICTHITPKCANCGRNHQATAFKCPARSKAQAKAWREKVQRGQGKDKQPANEESPDERPAPRHKMEVDNKATNWAKSPREQSSNLSPVRDSALEDSEKEW